MTKSRILLMLWFAASCDLDDDGDLDDVAPAPEIELDEDVDLRTRDAVDEPSASDELHGEVEPAAACASSYEEGCRFYTGTYELVWQCDFHDLEPWTPYVGEPEPTRFTVEAPPAAPSFDIPPGPWWPPHNCYQVDAEIVDDIVCQNSCSNCSLEICEDLQTGQQWWHIPIRRPHEFVECTGREYSTCGGGDDGDLPID